MGKNRKMRLVQVREPNGRISRSEVEPEYSPVLVKRLREAAFVGLRDSQWGTELGRLFLERKINSHMYAAGRWWAELADNYHQAMTGPRSSKAISLELGSKSSPPDPDSDEGKRIAQRERRAITEFLEAHAALLGAGKMAEISVRKLCEEDDGPTGHFELEAMRSGLSWIAAYREQLTKSRKSRHVR